MSRSRKQLSLFAAEEVSPETDLSHLLRPAGKTPQIGPEKSKLITRGPGRIAKLTSPHGSHRYVLHAGGVPVSGLQVMHLPGKDPQIAGVYTHPDHRRKGLASKLLAAAEKDFGARIKHSEGHLSEAGAGWASAMDAARKPKAPTPWKSPPLKASRQSQPFWMPSGEPVRYEKPKAFWMAKGEPARYWVAPALAALRAAGPPIAARAAPILGRVAPWMRAAPAAAGRAAPVAGAGRVAPAAAGAVGLRAAPQAGAGIAGLRAAGMPRPPVAQVRPLPGGPVAPRPVQGPVPRPGNAPVAARPVVGDAPARGALVRPPAAPQQAPAQPLAGGAPSRGSLLPQRPPRNVFRDIIANPPAAPARPLPGPPVAPRPVQVPGPRPTPAQPQPAPRPTPAPPQPGTRPTPAQPQPTPRPATPQPGQQPTPRPVPPPEPVPVPRPAPTQPTTRPEPRPTTPRTPTERQTRPEPSPRPSESPTVRPRNSTEPNPSPRPGQQGNPRTQPQPSRPGLGKAVATGAAAAAGSLGLPSLGGSSAKILDKPQGAPDLEPGLWAQDKDTRLGETARVSTPRHQPAAFWTPHAVHPVSATKPAPAAPAAVAHPQPTQPQAGHAPAAPAAPPRSPRVGRRPFWTPPPPQTQVPQTPTARRPWQFARTGGPDLFAADPAATTPHPPPVDQNAPTVPKPPPPARPKAIHLPPAEAPTHANDAWWHTHMHAPLLHTGTEISREPTEGNGINSAIKVGLHHPSWHGKDHLFGVFKAAEDDLTAAARPNIIPPGNPHGHEAATWEAAHILGLGDLVPATVSRDYHTKVGSLQKYVPGQLSASRMKRMGNEHDRFHQGQLPYAAALDAFIMNTDRHDGNWLVDPQTRRMTLIDHGLSFPHTYKNGLHGNSEILGKAINERVQVPLEVVEWERRWPDLVRSFKRHRLSDEQISLARRRLEDLSASARNGQTFFDWLRNSGVGKHYYLW